MQNPEITLETQPLAGGLRLAAAVEPLRTTSPLAVARVHRQLTLEEAARRAGILEEEAQWLEDGRVYRFPSADRALLTVLLYATALGVDHRMARELAGLPVPPLPPQANPRARRAILVAVAVAAAALLAAIWTPLGPRGSEGASPSARAALPPPWRVAVRVLNGSGDINYTRAIASKIQALGYRISFVGRADNFRYTQSAVYFPPHGDGVGDRLAHQLGVDLRPLPGGDDPRQLVFIAGPARGPGE